MGHPTNALTILGFAIMSIPNLTIRSHTEHRPATSSAGSLADELSDAFGMLRTDLISQYMNPGKGIRPPSRRYNWSETCSRLAEDSVTELHIRGVGERPGSNVGTITLNASWVPETRSLAVSGSIVWKSRLPDGSQIGTHTPESTLFQVGLRTSAKDPSSKAQAFEEEGTDMVI